MIANINQVNKWARKNDYPVVYVRHEKEESQLEYKSTGWQLQSDIMAYDTDNFVRKTTPDSFLQTNLDNILIDNKVTNLIVCGYATEFCIDTTVRRSASLGYSVILVADAHTTHSKDHVSVDVIRLHHNVTLSDLTSFQVKITAIDSSELIIM